MTDTAISIHQVLSHVQGKAICEPLENVMFYGVAPLSTATKFTISFLANEKYLDEAKTSQAGALLCSEQIVSQLSQNTTSTLIVCDNPYAAFAKVSQLFFKPKHSYQGLSPQSIVDESAKVAASATLFPNVFVGPGASIGERTVLYPGCFVGAGSTIGNDCILYPNVVVREGCSIGDRCIFNPGVVIGGDGFGFAPTAKENIKIPQIGGVFIADDVEIGANTTIDRGTIQDTKIGRQTKIDNLVAVGHNAEIGEFCLLAGQTGIAGSAKLGHRIVTGGQVGISGHLQVGDNVTIGPQSGITKNVPSGEIWMGSPSKPYREYNRWHAIVNRFVKEKDKKK